MYQILKMNLKCEIRLDSSVHLDVSSLEVLNEFRLNLWFGREERGDFVPTLHDLWI
jgi:hypothetical protein